MVTSSLDFQKSNDNFNFFENLKSSKELEESQDTFNKLHQSNQ